MPAVHIIEIRTRLSEDYAFFNSNMVRALAMKDATLENPLVAGGKQLRSGGCGEAEGNRRRNFCQEKSSLFCD
jgi:hypothetical protein